MKKIAFIVALLLPALYMAASSTLPLDTTYRAGTSCPIDTTFRYLDRAVVISEKEDELNVSIYRVTERGDTVESYKMYEGIFTDNRSIERRYEGSFEISVPDIFKPKKQRRPSRSHWAGFGVGFTNLPVGFDFDGELSSIITSADHCNTTSISLMVRGGWVTAISRASPVWASSSTPSIGKITRQSRWRITTR